MQASSRTLALLAVLLATTLAACVPTSGPLSDDAVPKASFTQPAPQPRLGFNNFTPPNI